MFFTDDLLPNESLVHELLEKMAPQEDSDAHSPFSNSLRNLMCKEETPNTAIEVMFIEQLEACHNMCLCMFQHGGRSKILDTQVKTMKIAEQLMRRFACTLDSFEKYRKRERSSSAPHLQGGTVNEFA